MLKIIVFFYKIYLTILRCINYNFQYGRSSYKKIFSVKTMAFFCNRQKDAFLFYKGGWKIL